MSEATAKERAQEAAGTAAEQSQHVAGVAAEEAKGVAAEAGQHARDLVGEARGHVDEQSRQQLDRLGGMLRTFGDDLEKMSQEGSGLAADVSRQVAQRARSLGDQVEGREASDLLEDVRGFARRRPGTFLLGALAAGVAAGRLTRGAKEAHQSESSRTTGAVGGSTTGGFPPAPATTPGMPAVPQQRSEDPLFGAMPGEGGTREGLDDGLGREGGYGARPGTTTGAPGTTSGLPGTDPLGTTPGGTDPQTGGATR